MLLTGARLPSGERADVRIECELVAAVAPSLARRDGEEVVELDGHLLLPAAAEPHAHLDKAFLAETITNPAGDLLGAIEAMEANRHLLAVDETMERAERAVRLMAGNGITVVRTHADVTPAHGLRSVEALVKVREAVRDVADLQIVALVAWPVTGPAAAENIALLRAALELGADVVGGCPHLDDDAHGANGVLLAIAAEYGLPVDLHTDETLEPGMCALEDLARRVIADQFPHPVTASHCVSLGVQSEQRQREVAALVAEAGISVVALPQTNLLLQGRQHQQAMPRAITPVQALQAAGVNVAAGADNLQDPFNPMGRGDPFETASLMVVGTHLLPDAAWHACSNAARAAVGHPPAGPVPGYVADLLAVPAATVREAIAMAPRDRFVLRRGVRHNVTV